MTNPRKINRHQREFLKKLRERRVGVDAEHWPSAAALRRWMRHEGFRAAFDSIRGAMQMRTDFELIAASVNASSSLSSLLSGGEETDNRSQIQSCVQLLRLAHLRLKELRQAGDVAALLESKKPRQFNPIHPNVMKNPALAEYLVGKLSGRIASDTPPPVRTAGWRD
ncbi:hypothetical protein BH10PLA1_BH10PLA1_23140 [soil metagenome]